MSERKAVTFDAQTWQLGDRGILSPGATRKPQIENLHLLPDGRLTPVPWYKDNSVQLEATATVTSRVFGAVYDYGRTGSYEDGLLVVDKNEIEFYRLDDDFSGRYAYNTAGVPDVNATSWVSRIDPTYWIVHDYLIECAGPAPATPKTIARSDIGAAIDTAFTVTFSATGNAVHQGRGFFWGPDVTGGTNSKLNYIYYSDAHSYATFASSSQFFQVDGLVAGALSLGPNLVIWTAEGRWYVLQGRGNPANATLNYVGVQRIPPEGYQPAVRDNIAIFPSADGVSMCMVDSTGRVDDDTLKHLGNVSPSSFRTVNVQPYANSIFNYTAIPLGTSDGTAYHELEGIWYKTELEPTLSGAYRTMVSQDPVEVINMWNTGDARWDIYRRDLTDNDLVIDVSNGSFASGWFDTSPAILGLPRISEPDKQVRITKIVLDCLTYGTTSSTNKPQPEVTCEVIDGDDNTLSTTVGPGTGLDEAGSGTTKNRFVFTMGPHPFTHSADIYFNDMQGITVEQVFVEYEVSEGRIQ